MYDINFVVSKATTSVRDKVHHLVVAMETQAYHCALTIHVLFLVGVVSGRSLTETMRKSPAIKLLPVSIAILKHLLCVCVLVYMYISGIM